MTNELQLSILSIVSVMESIFYIIFFNIPTFFAVKCFPEGAGTRDIKEESATTFFYCSSFS